MRSRVHDDPPFRREFVVQFQCRSGGARPRAPCAPFDRSPCCNIMATIVATTEMSRTSRNRREWTQCRHFGSLMIAVNHCDALGELSHSLPKWDGRRDVQE